MEHDSQSLLHRISYVGSSSRPAEFFRSHSRYFRPSSGGQLLEHARDAPLGFGRSSDVHHLTDAGLLRDGQAST